MDVGNLRVLISADISGLQNGMKRAESEVKGFGARMSGFGKTMQDMGRDIALLTAPLIGFGVVGVNTAASFQSSMNEISARTGLVGDDLNRIRDFALKMGADTAFSAQDAAAGFLQLLSSGSSAEEAIAALPSVMDLAAASGLDLGYSADLLTDTLKQFGLGIEDAAGTADVLVRAAGSSSATVGDLAQGFQNVGPVANMFGMSVEETAAALAVLAENGIKGAEGGTAMKSMLLNLARPTKKTQDALNDLGVSLYDADGNFRDLDSVIDDLDFALDGLPMDEQIYYSEALAGSYGITAFNALRAAGGIDEMQDSMLDATGAGDVAEARMQGFAGALEQLKGSFETLMIQAFTPFMDNFLTPMINKIVPIVNEIGNWIAANPKLVSSIGQLVIGGALLAVVMGILGTVFKVAFGPAGKLAVALGAAAVFINGMETGNLLVLAVGIAAVGVATGFLMGKKFVPFGIALAGVAAIINGIQAGRFGEVAVGIGAIGVAVGLATGGGKLFAFGIALGALGLVVNGIESQDMLQVAVGIAALSASVAVITGSPKVLLLGAAIGLLGVIVDGFNTGNMLQVSVGLVALGAAIAIFTGVGNVFVLGVALGALALVVDGFNTGSLTKMGIGIGALGTAVSLALGSGRLFGLSIILGGMALVVEGFDTDNVFLIAAGLTAVGVGAWAAFGPVGLLAAAIAVLVLAISQLMPGILESWGEAFRQIGIFIDIVIGKVESLIAKIREAANLVVGGWASGIDAILNPYGDAQRGGQGTSEFQSGYQENFGTYTPGYQIPVPGMGNVPTPQHATGLGYVPWDGYIASLHQGERVLTRREARDYNMGGDGGPINVYVTAYGSNPAEFGEMVRRELRGLAR